MPEPRTMRSQRTAVSPRTRRRRSEHNVAQGLAGLPAELRNYIWELAIPSNTKFDTSKFFTAEQFNSKYREAAEKRALKRHTTRKQERKPHIKTCANTACSCHARVRTEAQACAATVVRRVPLTPAITQVCAALRPETLAFFYGSNIFEFCTTDWMTYEVMERWLSGRPQIGLQAMRQVTVRYVLGPGHGNAQTYSLKLCLDLSSGEARPPALPPVLEDVPRRFSPLSTWYFHPQWHATDWPNDSSESRDHNGGDDIIVPVATLEQRNEETKRDHGFGDYQEQMTCERLMKILKAFNFYDKDLHKEVVANYGVRPFASVSEWMLDSMRFQIASSFVDRYDEDEVQPDRQPQQLKRHNRKPSRVPPSPRRCHIPKYHRPSNSSSKNLGRKGRR